MEKDSGITQKEEKSKDVIYAKIRGNKKQNLTEDEGLKDVVIEHNKFLDKYFESIEPKNEESLVRGLEELKWDRDDDHDYVDEEYISWNGSLYAIKVNSLSRFLSFMDLMKKDSIGVTKAIGTFSVRICGNVVKWFYFGLLNLWNRIDEIPPVLHDKDDEKQSKDATKVHWIMVVQVEQSFNARGKRSSRQQNKDKGSMLEEERRREDCEVRDAHEED
ncbi:hypothetical protein Tco_0550926 [Tanacetum coccineum]